MKIQRNNLVHEVCRIFLSTGLNIYHNIDYQGMEYIPKQGPVLLLPKHQSQKDIILEGCFLKGYCGRYGNWIMKSGLPGIFNYLGGIKVKRPRDLPKDRQKRKKLIKDTREFNQKAMQYVEWLYQHGEIVVAHPEGTRTPGKMGPLRRELFDHARQMEKKYNIKIPLIPLGIEYNPGIWSLRSNIFIRGGKPLEAATSNIEEIVKEEIAALSNL